MDPTGAYTAERAAALSGVPRSTLHHWARTGLVPPSVSRSRVKLWSYADLMALRTVYWLRRRKTTELGAEIPPTGMKLVRAAIERLRQVGEPLWHPERNSIWVDGEGVVHVRGIRGVETAVGQQLLVDEVDLLAPFATEDGGKGPDLSHPRPTLCIVPGRLSGAPHIEHTRLETRALAALESDGLELTEIQALYPYVTAAQIEDALELERQLEANLAFGAAA